MGTFALDYHICFNSDLSDKHILLRFMMSSLILAHSQGKYLASHYEENDGIDVVFKSGATVERLRHMIPDDIDRCQVIIVHGGENDVSAGWDSTTVLQRFQRLHAELRRRNSHAEIVFSGVIHREVSNWTKPTPRSSYDIQEGNRIAGHINASLKYRATVTPGLHFVDWPIFQEKRDLLARTLKVFQKVLFGIVPNVLKFI